MKEKFINFKNKAVELVKGKKNVLIGVAIVVLLLIIVIVAVNSIGKKESTTSGNLNNMGFAVSKGSWVYYLGFDGYEPDGIYKVKKNGSKAEKVTSDYGVYLNIDGNYIYYTDADSYGIIKMKTNGKSKETLVKNVDETPITVVDGWVYYSKNSSFYRIKTNGKDETKISSKSVETYQIVDNWVYYTYYNDGSYVLAKMKTDGTKGEKLDSDTSATFYVKGSQIYYVYEEYDSVNYEYSYDLYKIKTNGKSKEKIAEIDEMYGNYINMTKDGIYYIGSEGDYEYSIYYIKYDGKSKTKIVDLEGYSTPINVIDNWIYYTDDNDDGDTKTFKIKTNGNSKTEL